MKVVGVTEFGGPERLGVHDVEEPHAGPGEVRIRVHAAAINPTDTLLRAGSAGVEKSRPAPWIPGMDAAGVIDEIGDAAGRSRWSVGDRVAAIVLPAGPRGGAYAQWVVVPADSVARLPDGTAMAEGASVLMNALTAHRALDHLDLPPEGMLAVSGAAGAFGGFTVQLAAHRGHRVVADAADSDVELVRTLGAEHVVERGSAFAAAVRGLVPRGVDGLADGALLNEDGVAAVRDGGRIATLRGWGGDPGRGIATHAVRVSEGAQDAETLADLMSLVGRGILTPRVADVLSPEDAAEGHRRLEKGGVRGRLVLDLSRWQPAIVDR